MGIKVADVTGQTWEFVVDDAGLLGYDKTPAPPEQIVLRDYLKTDVTRCWLLGAEVIADEDGGSHVEITSSVVPYNPDAPWKITLMAPGGQAYWMGIVPQPDGSAEFITDLGTPDQPPTVSLVGSLWPMTEGYYKPQQPGGPGTPVTMPRQEIDAMTGRWSWPCGHTTGVGPEIIRTAIDGKPAALMCCPSCRYVVSFLPNYDDIYLEVNRAALS